LHDFTDTIDDMTSSGSNNRDSTQTKRKNKRWKKREEKETQNG